MKLCKTFSAYLLTFQSTKMSITKLYFPAKLYEIQNNVVIQNCLLQKDLQILIAKFFIRCIFLLLFLKNTVENLIFNFLTVFLNKVYDFFPFRDI